MSLAIRQYLDRVLTYANLPADEARAVRRELQDHLDTRIEKLRGEGVPIEDAVFGAIQEHGHPKVVGHALRPRWKWIDVRTHGTARGFIAIGPRAVGVFASGGLALGVFAFGGISLGLISWGGIAAGLLFAWGGLAISTWVAYGGLALGAIAMGGIAVGLVSTGGLAIGAWVPGAGHAISLYTDGAAPQWLRALAACLPPPRTFWAAALFGLPAAFVILYAATFWAMWREKRRIAAGEAIAVE